MNFFSDIIVEWYSKHKRNLPWRNTKDPYKIWISEIILQQTQVNQGLPYYKKFIKTFPNFSVLANANEEKVLKLWQGLGYYSRARNLHVAAKQIDKAGFFPTKYDDIISLKGVGEYTAAAIASFSYKQPYAVVDGNVFRLLSRFYGIKTPINITKGKKQFSDLAQKLLNRENPDTHNQAIMEFGSQICKPKKPNCINCPLNNKCIAYINSSINALPVKNNKIKLKTHYFEYFYFKMNGYTLIKKKTEKGIWQNMYEFPLIICKKFMKNENILNHQQFKLLIDNIDFDIESISVFKHVLSHKKINTRFWEINCFNELPKYNFKKIKIDEIDEIPIPRIIEKFIETKI